MLCLVPIRPNELGLCGRFGAVPGRAPDVPAEFEPEVEF